MSVIDDIKADEGFRGFAYHCSEGKLTLGHGINIETTPIPEEVSTLWLKMIVNDLYESFNSQPWFKMLNDTRQDVIINMAYQMGVNGVFKFKKMIAAIEQSDYERATDEMLDSKWARQTPERALRNAKKMRLGV